MPVARLQRYPQYNDEQLAPWFDEIAKGYCYKQAAARLSYDIKTIENTIHSDDEVGAHMIDLSVIASAKIRAGEQRPPSDRWDGLFDEYTPE